MVMMIRIFHFAALLLVAQALPNIVSVPDLHGDYDRAVQILEAAGLMDTRNGAWSGGTTTLVQTGDIADRGPESQKIFQLFARLAAEAKEEGGEVVNLLGNHELMNIQGDLRYVNKKEMKSVGGQAQWQAMWQPNADLGQQVRKFKTVAKVGSVLFVHAGLLPSFLKSGRSLEDLNRDMATALADNGTPQLRQFGALVGDDGPLWTRFYAGGDSQEMCDTVSQVLKQVGAERMVIGHTIQQRAEGEYRAKPACGGSLILADTGISRAYNGAMSFIRYDGASDEAIAFYPGLGIQEVLPKSPLSLKTSGKAQAAVLVQPALQTVKEEPPLHSWLKIAMSFHPVIFISVACSLVFAIFFFLRPVIQQQKFRFASLRSV